MATCRLRIYHGPDQDSQLAVSEPARSEMISVPLREILETLEDAMRGNRLWLHDFADDQVSISADLYDVMQAYQHYRRPSA